MARWLAALLAVMAAAGTVAAAQDVPLEYRVKAAYLLNFTRFVEWPAPPAAGSPLTICLAQANPFGEFLASTIAGETVAGRPLASRVVSVPDASCGVLFVPNGVAADPMLRAVASTPVLTVGDAPDFLQRGGMIAFVLEGGRVRFAINPAVAERHHLVISSRLLQLALRPAGVGGSR
jgi:hypothetical protein